MPEPASPDTDDATDDAAEPDDGWARARFRLRELRGRDRWLAIGLLVVVLVPFVVALVRAFHDGWVPSGDEANIATRAHDVFTRHPPLTGLPSTSRLYGDKISTNHPGPIEFYLMAVPLRVFGISVGPLLTAAAINAGFGIVVLWVFFRRLGPTAMLWAGVMLVVVFWSGGTAVLTDTLSSNMTMYALLCTAVLAWALIDGDLRLLPLAAVVASYAAQQHLAAGLVVVVLAAAVAVGLAVQIVVRARRGDAALTRVTLGWSLTALVVAVVCWVPVIGDELRSRPGNLTEIVKFARDNARPTLGFRSGVDQALHAITPPTVLGRTDTVGYFFLPRNSASTYAVGFVIVAALVALAWVTRARARGVSRLAVVALVVLAASVIDGGNVPSSLESFRVNLYRWTWTAAFMTWTTIGIGVAFLAARAFDRRADHPSVLARRAQRFGAPALLVIAALIATATIIVSGYDDHNREAPGFAVEERVGTAVLAHVDRHHPVVVVTYGYAAGLSVGPYVILRLVGAGIPVEVPSELATTYGSRRVYRPDTEPYALVISSAARRPDTEPGALITTQLFSAERTRLLDELATDVRGGKIVVSPDERAHIDSGYDPALRGFVDALLTELPKNPRDVLKQTSILQFIVKEMIRAPAPDQSLAKRLLELPSNRTTLGGDEQLQVHLLTPAQLRAARLPGF